MVRLRARYRRRLLTVWRIVLIVAAAALAIVLALREFGPPDWHAPDWSVLWLSGFVALTSLADKFAGIRRSKTEVERQLAVTRCQKAVMALLVYVSNVTHTDVRHLGVSVFVPRCFGRRLARVFRFRIGEHPAASAVAWKPGKGAVGACWSARRLVHRDWHERQRSYSAADMTQAEFAKVPGGADGFDFDEYRDISGKYLETVAVPIRSEGGAMLGVVSIDVAAAASNDGCVLNHDELDREVATSVNLIADDLGLLDELE